MLDIGSDPPSTETVLDLNMTPMIDVVFNLLIFFLLTLAFTRPIFDVDLPGATHSHVEPEPKEEIAISLTREGQIIVGETAVPLEQLQHRIEAMLAQNPQRLVRLQADRQSQFGLFVAVMDAAKDAGSAQLIIETTRSTREGGDGQ